MSRPRLHIGRYSRSIDQLPYDSAIWYCLEWGVEWYLGLSIHQRINEKANYDFSYWKINLDT